MDTRQKAIRIIKRIFPFIDVSELSVQFPNLQIDSIDFLTLRVELETNFNYRIPDKKWIDFNSLQEIVEFLVIEVNEPIENIKTTSKNGQDQLVKINMPEMAIEGLSESWLFKKIGSCHWDSLCRGLNMESHAILDDMGNRLYATFIRIKLEMKYSLNHYNENDLISIKDEMKRFGEGIYFSKINFDDIKSDNGLEASLMTSFAYRSQNDNKALSKSQPKSVNNNIVSLSRMPQFGNEYREIKKGKDIVLVLGSWEFKNSNEILYNSVYVLNPYYDINGVGLLYFAAYQIIADICVAQFYNLDKSIPFVFENKYHTVCRDIFYFANCNTEDEVKFELNSFEESSEGVIKYSCTLVRGSDNKKMAKVFCVKQRK